MPKNIYHINIKLKFCSIIRTLCTNYKTLPVVLNFVPFLLEKVEKWASEATVE